VSEVKIITQDGSPVDDEPQPGPDEEPTLGEEFRGIEEDVRAMAEDVAKGIRRFKNGVLFKIGLIAVSIKVVDVVGRIIIENQRLKAGQKPEEDDE
jgi:hypothetical protein